MTSPIGSSIIFPVWVYGCMGVWVREPRNPNPSCSTPTHPHTHTPIHPYTHTISGERPALARGFGRRAGVVDALLGEELFDQKVERLPVGAAHHGGLVGLREDERIAAACL